MIGRDEKMPNGVWGDGLGSSSESEAGLGCFSQRLEGKFFDGPSADGGGEKNEPLSGEETPTEGKSTPVEQALEISEARSEVREL